MLEDIELFKSAGVTGVVLGVLNPDGTVDVPRTRMWVFDVAPIIICPNKLRQAGGSCAPYTRCVREPRGQGQTRSALLQFVFIGLLT